MGRILLREFVEGDRPAFLAYQHDPRYIALGGPMEPDRHTHAEALFQTLMAWADERPRRNHQLAIVAAADPQALVGSGGLRRAGCGEDRAELGIELAPSYWGRYSYAIDAARALLVLGFGDLGLREVFGLTTSANARAARLARWFGATPGPTRPGPDWTRARGRREAEWRITREQWEGGPRWLAGPPPPC